MYKTKVELGHSRQHIAVNFLKDKGYDILSTNYRNILGQIDAIAKNKKTVFFVEAKTGSNQKLGQPAEAAEAKRQGKISQAELMFLKQDSLLIHPARFDVISIPNFYIRSNVELIKNAFDLTIAIYIRRLYVN